MAQEKRVAVIGAGVAGLSAAVELARFGYDVVMLEKGFFPGGHAVTFACKAGDECVKCGACVVEEKLADAISTDRIRMYTGTHLEKVNHSDKFRIEARKQPEYIDPSKCSGCGLCMKACGDGAILQGTSAHHVPFYAIDGEKCRGIGNGDCNACKNVCPEHAIDLNAKDTQVHQDVDAIIVATGFSAYTPVEKPYGYGLFPNVITNLELERMLRTQGEVRRPSDETLPQRIGFIQCVGSRDASLGHPWCSQVCCGSALRMAQRIKNQNPEIDITVFYIDIQTFGRNFDQRYASFRDSFHFIRIIPGDIYPMDGDRLKVITYDNEQLKELELELDLVVLSVGITPGQDNQFLAKTLGISVSDTGFLAMGTEQMGNGLFLAGTTQGPMNIMASVASGAQAASHAVRWLEATDKQGLSGR